MTILDELKRGIITRSPEETESVGARLAAALPDNAALALAGDLGAGKTTLTRGIARGLGIHRAVTSPTYTICTTYQGQRQLVHMDAYRLGSARDLDAIDIEDTLQPPFLLVVEWPGNIEGFLDAYPLYWLELSITPDHAHLIRLVEAASLR